MKSQQESGGFKIKDEVPHQEPDMPAPSFGLLTSGDVTVITQVMYLNTVEHLSKCWDVQTKSDIKRTPA